ncbi:phosphatase PAP2 family protein [Falsiroseomonas sp. E2-1-a20]|uniref:phosphatase PAP2 family protein n=1 Tax=Falsiroseomonas sp. E2-1-a20 TaxID=3239300 RepID=UPI003F38BE28
MRIEQEHGRRHPAERLVRVLASFGERMELGTVILLLLLAGSAWAFIELADAVVEGETLAIDRALLLALRSSTDPADPLGPGWLVEMGRDITALGGVAVLVLLILAVSVFMALRRLWHAAGLLLAAVGSGILASTLLKAAFDRTRPDLVPHGSYVSTASFPSGHSMMAAVVYLTLGVLLARVEPDGRVKVFVLGCAVLLTLLVGISRVYLGVHWPTDVLAGWTVGAGWALLFWLIARALQRRGRIETDTGG